MTYSYLLQTMELNFNPSNPTPWPPEFETHLHSIPPRSHPLDASINSSVPKRARNAKTSEQIQPSNPDTTAPQYLSFEGSGFDRDHFHCAGHVHALPAQHGIPGWQRITLMKYVLDGQGFYDPASCWAYEGVVLPGGQIILGRWWSPLHNEGDGGICGPFIFWNVRGPAEELVAGSPADGGWFVGRDQGKDHWV